MVKEKRDSPAHRSPTWQRPRHLPALVVYHFSTLDSALAEALTSVKNTFSASWRRLPTPRRSGGCGCSAAQVAERSHRGDWSLWMENSVRALHDEPARALRRTLEVRWHQALREVLDAAWPTARSTARTSVPP